MRSAHEVDLVVVVVGPDDFPLPGMVSTGRLVDVRNVHAERGECGVEFVERRRRFCRCVIVEPGVDCVVMGLLGIEEVAADACALRFVEQRQAEERDVRAGRSSEEHAVGHAAEVSAAPTPGTATPVRANLVILRLRLEVSSWGLMVVAMESDDPFRTCMALRHDVCPLSSQRRVPYIGARSPSLERIGDVAAPHAGTTRAGRPNPTCDSQRYSTSHVSDRTLASCGSSVGDGRSP